MTVVATDMRVWNAPEKADILVSELLGSFGDNELSPECLDGAQRFLKGTAQQRRILCLWLCADILLFALWCVVCRERHFYSVPLCVVCESDLHLKTVVRSEGLQQTEELRNQLCGETAQLL